jgi:hypothetical protein
MEARLHRANMHRKFQEDNLRATSDYENRAARDIFENQKRELQEEAIKQVQKKAKQLDAARTPGMKQTITSKYRGGGGGGAWGTPRRGRVCVGGVGEGGDGGENGTSRGPTCGFLASKRSASL